MILSNVASTLRKVLPARYCGAVIVAAGSASRMQGIEKIMAPLKGEPVIVHTVRAFQENPAIREIVVVTREDLIMPITKLCADFDKVQAVVQGGKSRPESVHLGLNALSKKVKLVAVQDGARPLVSQAVISRTVLAADKFAAAIPVIPVKDTIKVDGGGLVASTPERKNLRAVQTPQVFEFDLLRGALKHAAQTGAEITDDCSAVELMGMTVKMVEGDEKNIKITTPLDLKIAQLLLEEEV